MVRNYSMRFGILVCLRHVAAPAGVNYDRLLLFIWSYLLLLLFLLHNNILRLGQITEWVRPYDQFDRSIGER